MRRIKASLFLLFIGTAVWAQVTTSSPYSNFGMGELSRRSTIYNKGMGGTGYALRSQNQINVLNPAALTIDSLTFLLDVGLASNHYKLKDGNGNSVQTGNTGFDYLALAFPVTRWWNASIGLFPYSKIGYNFQITDLNVGKNDTTYYQYTGKGGLNQATLSQSFQPIKNLSVGISAGYLFGEVERYHYAALKQGGYVTKLYKNYYHKGLLLDFGTQYSVEVKPEYLLTIGGVFSMSPFMQYQNRRYLKPIITVSSIDSVESGWTKTDIAPTFGGGLGLSKKDVFSVGADVSLQKWAGKTVYGNKNPNLKDGLRISMGGDWTPNRYAPRGYFKRVNYRFGVWYENSYIQVMPVGASAYSAVVAKGVTFGVSLPFRQTMNKIQLAVEYGQRNCSGATLINENTLIFSFGFRIHESWFYKRKYD